MTKLVLLALLAACDAGVPRSKPEPVQKLVEVPVARDAGVLVPADAAGPTPALAGARLRMYSFDLPSQAECARTRLVLTLFDKSKNVLDEMKENSTCSGACTDKEKQEGADQLEALDKAIDDGKAFPGETDYNFTGCLETGLGTAKLFHKIAGRDVALITDRYIGPHDGVYDRYKLALEVCGKIYVSETFGEIQSHNWPIEDLDVTSDGASEVYVQTIEGSNASATMFRLRLPACPGTPQARELDWWPNPE